MKVGSIASMDTMYLKTRYNYIQKNNMTIFYLSNNEYMIVKGNTKIILTQKEYTTLQDLFDK